MLAQQAWVAELPIMMQSVLFAAVRAPDGIRKDHPVKVIMRWYRRSVLISAFDKAPINDPFYGGGGSFTGPFTNEQAYDYRVIPGLYTYYDFQKWWLSPNTTNEEKMNMFNGMREVYLRHVDELPHHFQLHLMHAAQIVGYHHPIDWIREWWRDFYLMIVNDAHLFPESKELMDLRLSDDPEEWRIREQVLAK